MSDQQDQSVVDEGVETSPDSVDRTFRVRRSYDLIGSTVSKFKGGKVPPGVRRGVIRAGVTPEWVLKMVVGLVEDPTLAATRRVDLLELANWWLMVSLGVRDEHRTVRPLRPRKFMAAAHCDERLVRASKGISQAVEKVEAVASGPLAVDGEGHLGQNGRDAKGLFTPGPGGPSKTDRRSKNRERYVRDRLGHGFLDRVSEADNG